MTVVLAILLKVRNEDEGKDEDDVFKRQEELAKMYPGAQAIHTV